MRILLNILNCGTSETLTARETRLLKYSNLAVVIVCCFILANLFCFWAFGDKSDSHLIIVLALHLLFISVSLFFNSRKKYLQFSDLLIKNHQLSQMQQADIINKAFLEWKGDLEQVDDVCVIGLKI